MRPMMIDQIAQERVDVWWEMHPMSVQSDSELRWLELCPTPCYVLDLADSQRLDVPDHRPDPIGNPAADNRSAVQWLHR